MKEKCEIQREGIEAGDEQCGAGPTGDAPENQTEPTWMGGEEEGGRVCSCFQTFGSLDGNFQHFEAV